MNLSIFLFNCYEPSVSPFLFEYIIRKWNKKVFLVLCPEIKVIIVGNVFFRENIRLMIYSLFMLSVKKILFLEYPNKEFLDWKFIGSRIPKAYIFGCLETKIWIEFKPLINYVMIIMGIGLRRVEYSSIMCNKPYKIYIELGVYPSKMPEYNDLCFKKLLFI